MYKHTLIRNVVSVRLRGQQLREVWLKYTGSRRRTGDQARPDSGFVKTSKFPRELTGPGLRATEQCGRSAPLLPPAVTGRRPPRGTQARPFLRETCKCESPLRNGEGALWRLVISQKSE